MIYRTVPRRGSVRHRGPTASRRPLGGKLGGQARLVRAPNTDWAVAPRKALVAEPGIWRTVRQVVGGKTATGPAAVLVSDGSYRSIGC